MKNKKILTICFILVLLCTAAIFTVSNNKKDIHEVDFSQLKVSFIDECFPIFDTSDKAQYVGYSDYVFVGKVEKITYGGRYSGNTYYPGGSIFSGKASTPYTEYEVSVLQNIKGQLKTDSTVSVKKHAGINTGTNTLTILPGDIMPVEGEEYVFLTRATEDGDLVILDPRGNVALSEAGNNIILAENITSSINYTDVTTTAANVTDEAVSTTAPIQSSTTETVKTTGLFDSSTKESIIDSYIAAYAQEVDPINRTETYISIYDIAA